MRSSTTVCLVAGMTLAGLLAGCATGQQAAGSAASDNHMASHHAFTPMAVPLNVVRTAPVGFVSAPWSVRPVAHAAASKRIYLTVDVPVCAGGQMAYTLTATSKYIKIGYWVRPRPTHSACSALRVTTDGYVQLPTAIGDRAITHIPVDLRASA